MSNGNGSSKNTLKIDQRIQLYEYLKQHREEIEREQFRPEQAAKNARIALGFSVTEFNVKNLDESTGIRWFNSRARPVPPTYSDADFETLVHAVAHLYAEDDRLQMFDPFERLASRVLQSNRPPNLQPTEALTP